jgi:glutamate racemase
MSQPVGVFDSGIGGVSVLTAIQKELPALDLIYVGDNLHLPYGEKSMPEIREYSKGVVEFLIAKECSVIVIACNTASAAALKYLRETFPQVVFIGMEPAVKPAAEQTQTGVVGVIATTATFQGELFASVVERFASGVKVIQQPCPGLVQQIEAGELSSPTTMQMLHGWLDPMKAQNIDRLVLGCTHYPFVAPAIKEILGDGVSIIDPAPAIAKQVRRVLAQRNQEPNNTIGITTCYTSGDEKKFAETYVQLTGQSEVVQHVQWNGNTLEV